jgi:hypothetical protein
MQHWSIQPQTAVPTQIGKESNTNAQRNKGKGHNREASKGI